MSRNLATIIEETMMTRLNDKQQMAIQHYLDKAVAEIEGVGLELTIESNLATWVAHMRQAPGTVAVSPTLDPEFSEVSSANSFWLSLRTQQGRIVASVAHRLFETDDFLSLIRSHKIFYDRKPLLHYRPLNVFAPPDAPMLAGRVGYGGGNWVDPEYRGRGLASYLPRIHRALGLRHFDIDWLVALVREQINTSNAYGDKVGVPHKFLCLRGWFPPRNADGEYGIIYASRHEIVAELIQATAAPSQIRTERFPAALAAAE